MGYSDPDYYMKEAAKQLENLSYSFKDRLKELEDRIAALENKIQ